MVLRSWLRKFQNLFIHIARNLLDLSAKAGKAEKISNRIVLVKVDAIGDFVLWLESAQALRKHFKDKEIFLVTNQIVAELASKLNLFDQVIGVDLTAYECQWAYRFRMNRRIYCLGAEIAIQTTYSRKYVEGDSLVRATSAAQRIGSVGDLHVRTPWQRVIADRWFTQLIPASEITLHEVDRNKEFLRGLGIESVDNTFPKVADLQLLPDKFKEEGYFVVFPGAGIEERMWPPENFGAVARFVTQTYGWRMVVCGASGEREIARYLLEVEGLSGSCDLTGKTSLPELVEVIRGARILIANETSAIHIAAAVDTSSVCLLGGGHFGRFMPYPDSFKGVRPIAAFKRMDCYECDWHCVYTLEKGSPFPCIDAIDLEFVIHQVKHHVEQHAGRED